MTKEELSALLGRPLTSVEDTNFDLYLSIATENLEELICTPLEDISETRTFDTRKDYKTAFVDIFWSVTEVKLDDVIIDSDDYSVRQWERRNATWYNSLVFDCNLEGKVLEVTADWGFSPSSDASSLPTDLQMILANLFSMVSQKNTFNGSIKSKKVEDFSITFQDGVDLDEEFYTKFYKTLTKYSLCNIPNVRHGRVLVC